MTCGHGVKKLCVRVVNDADTLSAKSLTPVCWHGVSIVNDNAHGIGVVNDYVDMAKTKRTHLENFEGFSQILKELYVEQINWWLN